MSEPATSPTPNEPARKTPALPKAAIVLMVLSGVLLLAAFALTVASWEPAATNPSMKQMCQNPAAYADQTVTVTGKVARVLDWGYTINDGKAEMPVIPRGAAPAVGSKIQVRAVVRVGYTHAYGRGKTMAFPLVLIEQ